MLVKFKKLFDFFISGSYNLKERVDQILKREVRKK